ncbi:hypothetical protein AX16_003832 [Volvariella volvacea WC 439]|nr:hypothetical protein AX16_003832 [Volvariella volvacea WC 439]
MPLWHRKVSSADLRGEAEDRSDTASVRSSRTTGDSFFRPGDLIPTPDNANALFPVAATGMGDRPPPYIHHSASASAPTFQVGPSSSSGPIIYLLDPPGPPPTNDMKRPIEPELLQEDMKYTFSDAGYGAMTVSLHNPSPRQREIGLGNPIYHISVRPNCFAPLSCKTILRRGGTADGELIGEFEMGISSETPRLVYKGREGSIIEVLSRSDRPKKKSPKAKGVWKWTLVPSSPEAQIQWDYSVHPVYTCSFKPRSGVQATVKPKLATFYAETMQSGRLVPAELEITPLGQEYFDEIIMSLLILERKRMAPVIRDEFEIDRLFNF